MESSHLLSSFWIPEQMWSLEPSLICAGIPSPPQSAHLFFTSTAVLSPTFFFLPFSPAPLALQPVGS